MTSNPQQEDRAPHRVSPAAIGGGPSLAAVSFQTGISVETLRVWQTRYGLGPELTTPEGDRRYTPGDIQRLRRVKHLVSEGLTTSEAVHAVLAVARSDLGLPPDADPVAHHLGAAALELDGPTARRLVDEHLRRGDVAHTWEAVLRPVLVAIGDRWAQLSLGAAVEHLLSHIVIELLSNDHGGHGGHGGHNGRNGHRTGDVMAAHTLTTQADGTSHADGVVLACVPGELHDLPLVVLDAALRSVGIITTRLAGPPADATLDDAVARLQQPVIALHAVAPGLADPAVFARCPARSTLLALGPGWRPDQLPAEVTHVNTLAGARERIASLVGARLDTRPHSHPDSRLDTRAP